MEQINLLILLSLGMLIGSYISGTVPMAFKLSDKKSRLLALMGSGILVGTALAIIIPEGINSIYTQPAQKAFPLSPSSGGDSESLTAQAQLLSDPGPPIDSWVIGIWLISGFVLMLLIDQFSMYQATSDSGRGGSDLSSEYTLTNQNDEDEEVVEYGRYDVDDSALTSSETKPIRDSGSHFISIRAATESPQNGHSQQSNYRDPQNVPSNSRVANTKMTPTLGLVIHAAADGIALGAAATTTHRDVEMIIFLAIMLHKAPAAFSLVVFLLHRGLKHSTIRRHLLTFSLSAPLAALLTYFGLSQSGKEALRQNNATGIAMLFSAGTFLYVATVHVMPELVHNRLLAPRELIFLVGGAFLPILLAETV